jgi:hypothetical protein
MVAKGEKIMTKQERMDHEMVLSNLKNPYL